MSIFFTADTHFQHDAIRRYCNRPFVSSDEMDEALIANWNAVVTKKDTVYHLGDVFFGDEGRALPKLKKLKGKKFLIPGNHDHKMDALKEIFEVLPALSTHSFSSAGQNYRVTLCHYAMLTWDRSHHGSLMLHGHTHGKLHENNQRLDVGVDCWGFYPVRFDAVLNKLKGLQTRSEEEDCE